MQGALQLNVKTKPHGFFSTRRQNGSHFVGLLFFPTKGRV